MFGFRRVHRETNDWSLGNLLSQGISLMRSLTILQASAAGCAAILACVVALAGYGTMGLLITLRHLPPISPVNVLPLYFDYSAPVASAIVDLSGWFAPAPSSALDPYLRRMQERLYPQQQPSSPLTAQEQEAHNQQHVSQQKDMPQHPYQDQSQDPLQGSQQQQQQQQQSGAQGRTQELHPSHAQSHAYQQQAQQSHQHVRWPHSSSPAGIPLSQGQQVRVSVTLQLPAQHQDLFQVSGELLTEDGGVAARAVRTHMPVTTPGLLRTLRHLVLAPCYAIGMCTDVAAISLVLFDGYVQRAEAPIKAFRVLLASRNASMGVLPPPPVHDAYVRLAMRMNLLHRMLYLLRPSVPFALSMGSLAAMVAFVASACAVFFLVLAIALCWLRGQLGQPAEGVPAQHAPSAGIAARGLITRTCGAENEDGESGDAWAASSEGEGGDDMLQQGEALQLHPSVQGEQLVDKALVLPTSTASELVAGAAASTEKEAALGSQGALGTLLDESEGDVLGNGSQGYAFSAGDARMQGAVQRRGKRHVD